MKQKWVLHVLVKCSTLVFLIELCCSICTNFGQHHFIEPESLSFHKGQDVSHLFNDFRFEHGISPKNINSFIYNYSGKVPELRMTYLSDFFINSFLVRLSRYSISFSSLPNTVILFPMYRSVSVTVSQKDLFKNVFFCLLSYY